MGFADGVDRREIDHVKPHRLRVIHALQTVAERGAFVRMAFGGAREKFVPGCKLRPVAVNAHLQIRQMLRGTRAVGPGDDEPLQFAPVRDGVHLRGLGSCQQLGDFAEAFFVFGEQRPVCRLAHNGRPFEGFAHEGSHAALEFFAELVLPGVERIAPGFDGVFVGRVLEKRTGGAPTVVDERCHRSLIPGYITELAPFQERADVVVPVFEYVGFDDQIVPGDPLERITAAIDQRREVFDNNSGLFRDHRCNSGNRGWPPVSRLPGGQCKPKAIREPPKS